MKLLFCPECLDVFNIALTEKVCSCGKTKGKYIDRLNAEYSGGIPLGFANSSFRTALDAHVKGGLGIDFTAFAIRPDSINFKKKSF